MRKFIQIWVINSISLWALSGLLKMILFPDMNTLVLAALALSILNATLRPILQIIALPISFMTLGLFSLLINGLVLGLSLTLAGAVVPSLLTLIIASILLAVLNSLIGNYVA